MTQDAYPLLNRPFNREQAVALASSLPANLQKFEIPENPNDCWIWTGGRSGVGYPNATSTGGRRGAPYRLIWEEVNGVILPRGRKFGIDHYACDNGSGGCVNPYHCRPATQKENTTRTTRTITGQHARKTHCPHGHEYTPENTRLWKGQRHCITCKTKYLNRWLDNNRDEYNRRRRERYASDPHVRELARARHQKAKERRKAS